MVKVIIGEKGSGKTKLLVELVREALNADNGDVVVIEKDVKLTYDVPYQARLITASDYDITSYELLKGLLCGIHAGNYDITHIFVDNFLKLVNDKSSESMSVFFAWLKQFSEREGIEFVVSISADASTVPDIVKEFVIN